MSDRSEEKPTDSFRLLPTTAPMPSMDQITSVSVIPFDTHGQIVAALLSHRGIDLPGGHTEAEDTTPEVTARREALEEICATLSDDLRLIGVIESSRQRHGKPTYMVIMTGEVKELLPLNFAPDEKSQGRATVTPDAFISKYRGLTFMPELVARACLIQSANRAPAIGVAFAGAGVHAVRAHAQHLKNMPGVTLAGVFDPNDASVRNLQAELGSAASLTRYACYEDLLSDPRVQGVVIGSPDRFHLPQLKAAVHAGKHVFCEKPMCNDAAELQDLESVLAYATEKGLTVTSCHPRRFDPPYIEVKNHVPEWIATHGSPLEIKLDFQYRKPALDRADLHGGSMLQDHMNHEFDYMNFLFGHAACTAHKLWDEADRYHVSGIREDGISFSFGGTRRLESHTYAETIEIRFERATVHVDTYDASRSYIHDHENPHAPMAPLKISTTDYEARFFAVNRDWVNAIRTGKAPYLNPEDLQGNSIMSVTFAQNPTVTYAPPFKKRALTP